MAIEGLNNAFYADPANLNGLKRDAAQSPEGLREVARQFESLFTTMMLKSMRSASEGDPMFGSDQADFYQDMFDQQLAVELGKGRGLGLADMLVRQLMGGTNAPGAVAAPLLPNAGGTDAAASWPPRSQQDFISAIRPAATRAARELRVDPDIVIAHAALETGWGRSVPAGANGEPSFNLFGIKAGGQWRGEATASLTNEYQGGRMQQVSAEFRAYASPDESMQDYVRLLKGSPRYAAALDTGSDAGAFARGLASGGYATDPDYVAKLTAVAARLKGGNSLPLNTTTT